VCTLICVSLICRAQANFYIMNIFDTFHKIELGGKFIFAVFSSQFIFLRVVMPQNLLCILYLFTADLNYISEIYASYSYNRCNFIEDSQYPIQIFYGILSIL
jgi:hypothetical protein